MTRLELNISHRFSSGFSLEVDFVLNDGVTALFGPSGSGKSTLLLILAGITKPHAGRIVFDDNVLLDTASGVFVPPHKRHLGFVFQDHLLFPHLSVEKNLRYGMIRGAGKQNGITFDKVIEILELGSFLQQYPKTLSGGQQQRVALGRALLSGPGLLLMDEPLTALDEGLKARVIHYLERVFVEWHIPTVYVSHSIREVMQLADQTVLLKDGCVQDQGRTEDVLAHLGDDLWRFRNGNVDRELKELSEKWPNLSIELRKRLLADVRKAEMLSAGVELSRAVAS